MPERLILSLELFENMRAHVQACLPEEACGLLIGSGELVKFVIPITNELHSPVRFRMAPEEQYKAFLWLEDHALDLLGYYHSHPVGPEHLSQTDVQDFFYPGVVMVLFFNYNSNWQVKGFIIENDAVKEANIEINE